MLTLKTTMQFRKDYKLMKKRGYKMDLLEDIWEHFCRKSHLRRSIATMRLLGIIPAFGSAMYSLIGC